MSAIVWLLQRFTTKIQHFVIFARRSEALWSVTVELRKLLANHKLWCTYLIVLLIVPREIKMGENTGLVMEVKGSQHQRDPN